MKINILDWETTFFLLLLHTLSGYRKPLQGSLLQYENTTTFRLLQSCWNHIANKFGKVKNVNYCHSSYPQISRKLSVFWIIEMCFKGEWNDRKFTWSQLYHAFFWYKVCTVLMDWKMASFWHKLYFFRWFLSYANSKIN